MKKLIAKLTASVAMLVVVLNLSGCVAGAIGGAVAGVVVGGVLVYHHKSIENYVDDKTIDFTANNAIYGDKALFGNNHIVLAVDHGTVLLVGQAITDAYKQQAEGLVKNRAGVQRVYNEISVEAPTSLWQQSLDNVITIRLKSAMLAKKDFDPSAVQVITENNVVYLMGIVTPGQADDAVALATATPGVTKVVKVFQYINS